MPKDNGLEQAFQDLLEGKTPGGASSQLEPLAKLASSLRSDASGPKPQFKARLRSQLLAQASETPEDVFAAALDGMLLDVPADIKPLVMVASALDAVELPAPRAAFRFQLRNELVAAASGAQTRGGTVGARVAALNDRMRRSFRTVLAAGMAAAVLAGSSMAMAASSNALPGDPLYGLKRFRESTQLVALSGVDEGNRLLTFATVRLSEVKGLVQRGSTSQPLYVDTLNSMDDSTVRGAEILIDEFRAHGTKDALEHVTSFATVQAQDLTSLLGQLPAGVQPAARDSLSVVERVKDRAEAALAGCPCPSNALQDAASAPKTGSSSTPACTCQFGTGRTTSGSQNSNDTSTGPSNPQNPGNPGGPGPQPSPSPSPSTGPITPPVDLPGSTDNQVEDTLNNLINSTTPTPLPTLSPLPVPSVPGLP